MDLLHLVSLLALIHLKELYAFIFIFCQDLQSPFPFSYYLTLVIIPSSISPRRSHFHHSIQLGCITYIYESWLNLTLNLRILLSSLSGNNFVEAHELRYRFCQRKAQAVVRTVNEHLRKKWYPITPFFEIPLCIHSVLTFK